MKVNNTLVECEQCGFMVDLNDLERGKMIMEVHNNIEHGGKS